MLLFYEISFGLAMVVKEATMKRSKMAIILGQKTEVWDKLMGSEVSSDSDLHGRAPAVCPTGSKASWGPFNWVL